MVVENERGELSCSGRKSFQSMATKADILLFSGILDDEEETMGMFYCQLAGQKNITVGKSLFSGAMSLTDTKPLVFQDVVLKNRQILSLDNWLTFHVSNYATSWFEALISAAYLGGASKALEEVRLFSRSVSHDEETLLAELDGFQLEGGRLSAQHRAALAFGLSFGACAGRYCKAVIEDAPEDEVAGLQSDIMDSSSGIKYTCTKVAQDVVNGARALVGTRSMSTKHPIHALTEQICFGPLHPTIPAHYERGVGEELLGEEEYTGLFYWGFG